MADKVITVSGLIEETAANLKAREELVEKIAAGREMLRYLDKLGNTNAEQKRWIAEAFPPRKAKEEGEESNGGGE